MVFAAASSASLVNATSFPLAELTTPGDSLLLLGFVQKRPNHVITLPADWTERLTQVSTALGLGEKRWSLIERYVPLADGPYADVLTTGTTCGWGTIQAALRATDETQPTNDDQAYDEYVVSTDAPTLDVTLPDAPAVGSTLIAYISPSQFGDDPSWSSDLSNHGWTVPAGWNTYVEVDPSATTSESVVAYKIADGSETGPLTFGTTRHDALALLVMIAEYAAEPLPAPVPGVGVEWGGAFEFERIKEWTITRGASPELTGSTSAGSGTVVLINTPDDRYNPENVGGDLYGFLHDGPRVWIGVNEDGTVAPDEAKDVYGLHAGQITEVVVEPEGGADVAPFVTIVTEDPLAWADRQRVTLPDSRTRSQADLRAEVMDELGWVGIVPPEPATLPLSSADGTALRILNDINAANGTRHYAKPEDSAEAWFRYVAVRRTSGLDGSSSASLNAGSDHVTSTSGWRISADGIINQQKASVEPVDFSPLRDVWEADDPLPTVVTGTPYVVWVEFPDFVDGPVVDVASTGGTLTTTLVPFGKTAKLTLTSSSTNIIQRLAIQGHIAVRGSVASFVKDDTASQAEPRGVRAGPDLTGDYLGTLTSAEGFARHIVYRFAGPLYRPTVTVVNWFPEMFALDLFDRISITVAQLSITDRIFEIVGLTHHGEVAALNGSTPVVLHTTTYVLQECREQTDPGWFILDESLLDGDDILAY